MSAMTHAAFLTAMKIGAYADGGYPVSFVTRDGRTLHPGCVRKDEGISAWLLDPEDDQGAPTGHGANWEDPELFCDVCSDRIESAYAEDYVTQKGVVDFGADGGQTTCAVCLADASLSILERDGSEELEPYIKTRKGYKPRAFVDGKPLLICVDSLDERGYVVRSKDAIPQWGEIGSDGHSARFKLICWRD